MSSGFFELEGGSQPALPVGDYIRIWKDNSDNTFKVLFPDGRNVKLSDITSETLKNVILPDDEILIYDSSLNSFRKMQARDVTPLAIQTRFVTYDEDEFLASITAGKLGWIVTTSGSGASGQLGVYGVNGTEKALGVLQLDTGTTATGRATLNRSINTVQMGYCSFEQVWRLAVEELSTPTERFTVYCGFIDNTGSGDHSDGVYFRYRDDLNSGQWQCVCREGTIETVVDTSVIVNTVYNIFRIVVNSNATQAMFYINDVLVATINSNLPSTQGNLTGVGAKIEKSVGSTQRNISIDYHTQKSEWPSGR